MPRSSRAILLAAGFLSFFLSIPSPSWASEVAGASARPAPGLIWAVPFAALLLSIAVLPLFPRTSHWWESNRNKLMLGLVLGGLVLAHYGLRGYGVVTGRGETTAPGAPTAAAVFEHAVLGEYLPFIVLLLSLYIVSGGLQLRGDLRAFPCVNTAFLAVGAVLASLIGTTGASMVLIRPLLQTNRDRQYVRHTVVFFIFLVSNMGGSLLPIGDPPLFLGYLKGVPFLWTLSLFPAWLFCVASLLGIYYVWDRLAYRREQAYRIQLDQQHVSPLRLRGSINLIWLVGIVLSVALIVPGQPLPGIEIVVGDYVREAVMLGFAGLSLATTPRGLRRETEFTYHAIAEVAALFLGIFLTMQVPTEILRSRGAELGLASPVEFFWASGLLSSFLDNAPTYVVFLETGITLPDPPGAAVVTLPAGTIAAKLLLAISLGSVFMGANTYIGNGPNFMVKSIAEHRGVKMPGFFGYMAYSGAILLPLFVVVSLLFLAG
jgi:Na+/H+ antiporter NhaD/arsenite permease-like protein